MEIHRLRAFSDNYIFLLYDRSKNLAAVVDPGEAQPVLKLLNQLDAQLIAIFNTHHHYDHIGGNLHLQKHFPEICIYGGAKDQGRIPGQQVFLQEGDRVEFSERVGEVFFVPGHTRAHIVYYFPSERENETGELFCGDTIFAGGCGRLKEGTPAQMVDSLSKLRKLPDKTRIWCAHEYTLQNLKFALTVDPENSQLQTRYQEVKRLREKSQATIPSQLAIEKQTNPFLRWDTQAIQQAVGLQDPVRVFSRLRGKKDQF
ncbi:MAG: hydroxyacylglutathione hydrolase [Spirulinaceae cyanobacterium]